MARKRKTLLATVAAVLCLVGFPAWGAEYPTKPVTLVIPYPAGGSTDVTGRAFAHAVKPLLGQPVIVENKTGAGGTVGIHLVSTKPPDGYTLGINASSAVAIAAHMGKLQFNALEDLTPILRFSGYLFGLVVRADSPWKTIQEFLQYVKANPQKLSYGTPGMGTTAHLAMEELSLLAGLQLIHVPYKGVAESTTSLLGGHVEAISDSSGWAPLVDAGKFRLLVTYGQQRIARYPQVPTLKEIGYDVVYPSPLEIVGPRGLPKPIVQRLHDAFKKAMEDPDYQAALNKFYMSNIYLNTEDVEKANRQDYERLGKLVRRLGLQKK